VGLKQGPLAHHCTDPASTIGSSKHDPGNVIPMLN